MRSRRCRCLIHVMIPTVLREAGIEFHGRHHCFRDLIPLRKNIIRLIAPDGRLSDVLMRVFVGLIFLALWSPLQAKAEIVVIPGGRVTLSTIGSFDQVCHSQGRMTINVIEQPQGGSILVDNVRGYPNFAAFNTRSRCNTLKLPQTRVQYQSAPGYTGTDETVIEFIGPLGRVFRRRYVISVRPDLALQPAPGAQTAFREHVHHHKVAKAGVTAQASSSSHGHTTSPSARKRQRVEKSTIGI